jgi:putative ABC transport system permease protein
MIADLKFAARLLAHARGFTITALVILTLGIGATATMFGAAYAVLFKPLPYPDPDRLVIVSETRAQAGFERTVLSAKEYLDWARGSRVLENAAIADMPGYAFALGTDAAVRLSTLRVSAEFFPLLALHPIAGRAFTRDEEQPGRADVFIISYRVWQERFGGAAGVVGRTVRLEGRQATVIGILPARFSFQGPIDLIVPLTLSPSLLQDQDHSFEVIARLAPNVTHQQANAELTRAALAAQPAPAHATGATVTPLRDQLIGDAREPILLMSGAVGFVLLIACANIANLLLARGAARQREIAIRAALGAGRARVARQLLTESLLLAAGGGAGGALLATWLTALLARSADDLMPLAGGIHVDAMTLVFTTAIAMAAGALFGSVPAWQASRTDVNETLKTEARGSSAARRRALGALVVAEIALALMLLVGAGLLLTSFAYLRRIDPGFDAAHVLVVPAFLPEWKYATPDAQRAFFDRATGDLAAVQGVEAVGATDALPLSGDNSSGSLTIEGMPAPAASARPNADRRAVTADFHRAMGIRLEAGRPFGATDTDRAPLVVIVSRGFADHYWPNENAIGKRIKLARFETAAPWRTVVGIVNDVQHVSLAGRPRPVVYVPFAQGPTPAMQLVVRTAAAPASATAGVRTALTAIDPDLPVSELRPMTYFLSGDMAATELAFTLLAAFAAIATVLAAAGIYGVMAYAVAQRRVEVGIRMALGASRADVLRLVGMHGIWLTAIGLALGLAGAALASSLLENLLTGVRPGDPRVFAATAILLAAVSLLACLAPALGATRVEPSDALRAR